MHRILGIEILLAVIVSSILLWVLIFAPTQKQPKYIGTSFTKYSEPVPLLQKDAKKNISNSTKKVVSPLLTSYTTAITARKSTPIIPVASIKTNKAQDIFSSLIPATKNPTEQTPVTLFAENTLWDGRYSTPVAYQPPLTTTVKSPQQRELHSYGNTLGAILTTFTLAHADKITVLTVFLKDRTNTTALKKLSDAYPPLAETISSIKAPLPVANIQTLLSGGYTSMGIHLWALSLPKNDNALLKSIYAYNDAATIVARQQIALITLFKEYDITFTSNEPGKIFMFTAPGF